MKNSAGFTLAELVVTITLVGILVMTAIPTFSKLIERTQFQINLSNMQIIKDSFLQYYYENHMIGNPIFQTFCQEPLMYYK